MSKANPRRKNSTARNRIRDRWKAIGAPCGICGKPIDYTLGFITDPRTGKRRMHPMAFVVDEIIPVSKGGDPLEFANTRPTHWICNSMRGDGTKKRTTIKALPQPFDDW